MAATETERMIGRALDLLIFPVWMGDVARCSFVFQLCLSADPEPWQRGFGNRRKLTLAVVGQFAVSRGSAPPLSSEPCSTASQATSTS